MNPRANGRKCPRRSGKNRDEPVGSKHCVLEDLPIAKTSFANRRLGTHSAS